MSVSAVLKCLRSWLTGSHQSYTQFLTAVTVVHRASRPHLVTRSVLTLNIKNSDIKRLLGSESLGHWRRHSVRGLSTFSLMERTDSVSVRHL